MRQYFDFFATLPELSVVPGSLHCSSVRIFHAGTPQATAVSSGSYTFKYRCDGGNGGANSSSSSSKDVKSDSDSGPSSDEKKGVNPATMEAPKYKVVPARFTFTYRLRTCHDDDTDADDNADDHAATSNSDNHGDDVDEEDDEEKKDAAEAAEWASGFALRPTAAPSFAQATAQATAQAEQPKKRRWVITHHHSSGMPSQPPALPRLSELVDKGAIPAAEC